MTSNRVNRAHGPTKESKQQMMLAVLKARFAAEQAHDTEAADRGSELGDFDTEPFDTEPLCTGLDDDFDFGGCAFSSDGYLATVLPVRTGPTLVQCQFLRASPSLLPV